MKAHLAGKQVGMHLQLAALVVLQLALYRPHIEHLYSCLTVGRYSAGGEAWEKGGAGIPGAVGDQYIWAPVQFPDEASPIVQLSAGATWFCADCLRQITEIGMLPACRLDLQGRPDI